MRPHWSLLQSCGPLMKKKMSRDKRRTVNRGNEPTFDQRLRRQSPAPPRPTPPDPYVTIGVRAHVEPPGWRPTPAGPKPTPGVTLLFATQAKDEPGEPLGFGAYALVAPKPEDVLGPDPGDLLPLSDPVEIGVFYADDASTKEREALRKECRSLGLPEPISRKAFLKILHKRCYEDRAALVAFHVPTEIGRLAVDWSRAAKNPLRGGWSQILWTRPGEGTRKHPTLANGEIEDFHYPRIVTRAIDSHRADVRFKPTRGEPYWEGAFVSTQVLAEALTGSQLGTLDAICEAFEAPSPQLTDSPLASLLARLRTMSDLYPRLLRLHLDASPDRPPNPLISGGTYAQALLRQTELRPPLTHWPYFPRELLAVTLASYFSGETFLQARTTSLPIMSLDFRGAFGVSAALVGASQALTASRVEAVAQDPEAIRRRVDMLVRKARRFVHGHGPPLTKAGWRFIAWTTVILEPETTLLPTERAGARTGACDAGPFGADGGRYPTASPTSSSIVLRTEQFRASWRHSPCARADMPPPKRFGFRPGASSIQVPRIWRWP
jgi:hypothetical protein